MTEEIPTKRSYTKQPVQIAYTIPIPFGMTLEVKSSANAWWMERQKLHDLISAFKYQCTIAEACLAAGITLRQYKYFVKEHPEFREAREGYFLETSMRARITISRAIADGNLRAARWYMTKTHPEEFGSPSRRVTRKTQKLKEAQVNQGRTFTPEVHKVIEEMNEKIKKALKA